MLMKQILISLNMDDIKNLEINLSAGSIKCEKTLEDEDAIKALLDSK